MNEQTQQRLWQLFSLLADGEFYSGSYLGSQLGLSRATIHNILAQAETLGIAIQKVHGRGYRLAQAWQPLEKHQILCHLPANSPFKLELHRQLDSSNSELMRRLSPELASGTVVCAELQTAGRGRLGRSWHSTLGNALTFSLLWRFNCGLNDLAGLSLAVGIAVIRSLRLLNITSAKLKWPNDVVCDQGKLGGILLEAQGDMLGPCAVVIGIGLNCQLPQHLNSQIDQASTCLQALCPAPINRNQLFATLLQQLAELLPSFEQTGLANLKTEWQSYHQYQNQMLTLRLPDQSQLSGVALGINATGALLIQQNDDIKTIYSAEITTADYPD